jgi:hypothetical protein
MRQISNVFGTPRQITMVPPPKERKTRIIVQSTVNWEQIRDQNHDLILQNEIPGPALDFIRRQIHHKVMGYKYQDVQKQLFVPEKFVDEEYTIELIKKSNFQCIYCNHHVKLVYEHVRDPKQWTLDRMDNKLGHIKGNVEIACLQCNVHRKVMFQNRFAFAKKLNVKKLDS